MSFIRPSSGTEKNGLENYKKLAKPTSSFISINSWFILIHNEKLIDTKQEKNFLRNLKPRSWKRPQ